MEMDGWKTRTTEDKPTIAFVYDLDKHKLLIQKYSSAKDKDVADTILHEYTQNEQITAGGEIQDFLWKCLCNLICVFDFFARWQEEQDGEQLIIDGLETDNMAKVVEGNMLVSDANSGYY